MDPFRFLTRTSQSMKINTFFWLKGSERSVPVSFWHFAIMVFAVLYVLHVLLEIPRFPSEAMDLAVSAGRSRSFSSSDVHPPF